MPYLISFAYQPVRWGQDGRRDIYPREEAIVATTRRPEEFVLDARTKLLEISERGGTPQDTADDLRAILSVVEIDDAAYVRLNGLL